jgi:hypothetical protein
MGVSLHRHWDAAVAQERSKIDATPNLRLGDSRCAGAQRDRPAGATGRRIARFRVAADQIFGSARRFDFVWRRIVGCG